MATAKRKEIEAEEQLEDKDKLGTATLQLARSIRYKELLFTKAQYPTRILPSSTRRRGIIVAGSRFKLKSQTF